MKSKREMVGVAGENLKREIRSIRLNLKSIGPHFFMSIRSAPKFFYLDCGASLPILFLLIWLTKNENTIFMFHLIFSFIH